MENCVVVGRGLAYANAYELALKLMETCYVVAERFSSADFLHGPLAMVERHFPVILFAPPGVMLPGVKSLIERLRELHADTLAITSDSDAASLCTRSILMSREIDEFLAPIPTSFPVNCSRRCWPKQKDSTRTRHARLSKVDTHTLRRIMNIELKDLSHNPVYAQVREQIQSQINNKTLTAGDSLPSPIALAQKLSVDKGEIQRAYFELEQLGLITKQAGKDFLGKPRIDYKVR